MKRASLLAGAAALAGVAAIACVSPAHAGTSNYSYNGYAGATQVQALGVTVQSNATAPSSASGTGDAHASNTIASAKAGLLLTAGAASTDVTATTNGTGGLTVVAHARTAGISLLNGLIKLSAIDSTATVVGDGTNNPTTSMKTELLGLTINGKKYPVDVAPNTKVTIPGVVTINLNAMTTASAPNSALVVGNGLRLTLLGNRNGTSAGATIAVNPLAIVVEPANYPASPGYALGGGAFGTYITANVGDQIQVQSGPTAPLMMSTFGTNGGTQSNSTAKAYLANVLNLGAIQSSQFGVRSDALSEATESNTIANLSLFNGLITATALGTNSTASYSNGQGSTSGGLTFVKLTIAGKAIPLDVAPNTTIHVLNLGTITINEQSRVAVNGVEHLSRNIGLHIHLDTKKAGLPIGADIQVAATQAIVYQ